MAEMSEQQQQTKPVPLTETSNATDSEHEDSLTLQDCVEPEDEAAVNQVLKEGPNQNISEEANEKEVVFLKGGSQQNEVATNEENLQRKTNQKIYVEKEATILKKEILKAEPNNKAAEKSYYDNSGKRGFFGMIQDNDDESFKKGNQKDKDVLLEFFKNTLGFNVKTYDSFGDLDARLEEDLDLRSIQYYCLMICISGHGQENEVATKTLTWAKPEKEIVTVMLESKSIDDIKKRFSNKTIPTLAGVPKIILLDVCRGNKLNKTISTNDLSADMAMKGYDNSVKVSPTTDSDICLIHSTTHGHVSAIPDNGSVGIQGVMKAFYGNWKNNHLEEMLIDAREEVAKFSKTHKNEELRQTLEIYTTLTKRLKFVKSSQ